MVSEQLQVRELAAPKECSPHWRAWPRAWLTRSNIVCCRSVGAHASDAGDASLAEEAGACVIQSVVIHAIEQEDGGWYSLEKSERSVKNLNQESHPLWVKAIHLDASCNGSVRVELSGQRTTSDSGALLLREALNNSGVIEALENNLVDSAIRYASATHWPVSCVPWCCSARWAGSISAIPTRCAVIRFGSWPAATRVG